MGIFSSVSRYLKTCGRLLYADSLGMAAPSSSASGLARDRKGQATPHDKYLEMLEPRVMMTTVFGGESFQYTDALGNTVTATLNGNVVAELVSAVQVGGDRGRKNGPAATGGYLMFGDIAGKFTSGPRKNVVIGNGSIPINNGSQGNPGAMVTVAGLAYPSAQNPGQRINLTTVASDAQGDLFSFNLFNQSQTGGTMLSANDSTETLWTMQVIEFPNGSSAGTPVLTVTSDDAASLLP
ncbi:MAG TPA: hypothetical protein VGN88_10305, partial [Phycisphaerae bacterium]